MPIEHVKVRSRPGYRWGKSGRLHTYDVGNREGAKRARAAAVADGQRADAARDKEQRHRNEDDVPKPPPQSRSRQLLLLLLLLWWADDQRKLEQRLAEWAQFRGFGRDGRISQADEGALLAMTRRSAPPLVPGPAAAALAAAAAAVSARRWGRLTSEVVGRQVALSSAATSSTQIRYANRLTAAPAEVAAGLDAAAVKVIRSAASRGATVAELQAALRTTSRSLRRLVVAKVDDGINELDVDIAERTQTSAGLDDYVWLTMGDAKVRREHRALDGKRQSWSRPPAAGPGGAPAHPGQAPNCRCRAMPVANPASRP